MGNETVSGSRASRAAEKSWTRGLTQFRALELRPRRLRPNGVGNWTQHLPFAFALVAALRPRRLVELGVHAGESYFGLCEALERAGLSDHSAAWGVDSWRGDIHSGSYPEGVYEEVHAYNKRHYEAFSVLLRMQFSEALSRFEAESIDLLHIDGRHDYESVREDFFSWLPKVSPGGVVLLHDAIERERGFGVWRLLEGLRERFALRIFTPHPGLAVLRKAPPGTSPAEAEGPVWWRRFWDEKAGGTAEVRRFFEDEGRILEAIAKADELDNMRAEAHQGQFDLLLAPEGEETRAWPAFAQSKPIGGMLTDWEVSGSRPSEQRERRWWVRINQTRCLIRIASLWVAAEHPSGDSLEFSLEPWQVRRLFAWAGAVGVGKTGEFEDFAIQHRPLLLNLERELPALAGSSSIRLLGQAAFFPEEGVLGQHLILGSQLQETQHRRARFDLERQSHDIQQLLQETGALRQEVVALRGEKEKLSASLRRYNQAIASVDSSRWSWLERLRMLVKPERKDLIPNDLREDSAVAEANPKPNLSQDYAAWAAEFEALTDERRVKMEEVQDNWCYRPLVSLIVPVYDPLSKHFEEAVASIREQIYPGWELILVDDASTKDWIRPRLEALAAEDSRISAFFRQENGHIAAASNSGLEEAAGEWVAFVDQDDSLTPDALWQVVKELQDSPEKVALVYTDEDKLAPDGKLTAPVFKPAWDPDLLLAQNYLCHLCVLRPERLRQVGGFDSAFVGSQDWEMLLRYTEGLDTAAIRHIPHACYHWRMWEGSTAQSSEAKPYAVEAGHRAVAATLDRRHGGSWRMELREAFPAAVPTPPHPLPRVSLLIPMRDQAGLTQRLLTSLERTTYPRDYFEILLIDNDSAEATTLHWLGELARTGRARVLRAPGDFNFSRINNEAARQAKGDILVLLNNDLELETPGWLEEVVGHVSRPEIGAVGMRLLYPDRRIQHAGVATGVRLIAGHLQAGMPMHNGAHQGRERITRRVSAVTAAALAVRRQVYEAVGGLDEALAVAFNDIDFCLRLREAGYENLYLPHATLMHHESASRGPEDDPEKQARFAREIEIMLARWSRVLPHDPYYHPKLTLESDDLGLAVPPRLERYPD